ncbi:MAG: phosphotransacetylase family protein, partial [Chloroflexota bacterium]|nr:phosphotransacetylase family protein [Chloroflexota bacterium]
MKSLYITSVDQYSGKTALCLALGKMYQARGYKIGYLKPFSLQPWKIQGKLADEDASFVSDTLGLDAEPWELSPIVVTPERLRAHLTSTEETNLMETVYIAVEKASQGQDLLILEGGGSLCEGYVMDFAAPDVAAELGSNILVVVKFRDEVRVLDDILTAKFRLGKSMSGVVINRVPEKFLGYVTNLVMPYLEKKGVPVLGILPNERGLAALTVGEIIDVLGAEILTKEVDRDVFIEVLVVGAMSEDSAIRRFRKQHNKAVITGGDRTDIQLAALETSTSCLILTGNLRPNNLIIKQADQMKVPILLVPGNTMETVETLDSIFGKTRLGQRAKLEMF